MNVASTTVQRYDYTRTERRANGVVGAKYPQNDSALQNDPPRLDAPEKPLQGEIVNGESPRTFMRVRGVTMEGYISHTQEAILTYRINQTISPSTINTPGRLLDTHV